MIFRRKSFAALFCVLLGFVQAFAFGLAIAQEKDADWQRMSKALEAKGGFSGNKALREFLGWNKARYWEAHSKLIQKEIAVKGRGKGGSLRLSSTSATTQCVVGKDRIRELDLYEPIAATLGKEWVLGEGYTNHRVEITASQGSRNTGGRWTRPDVLVVGFQSFDFSPTRALEVVSFEVKPCDALDVTAIFEALSHREYANRSYVLFALDIDSFNAHGSSERLIQIAGRYGIGIIVAAELNDIDEWEVVVPAESVVVPPARLDEFIELSVSEKGKRSIRRWN